ncbi:hypothetical protein RchiOBHm_Chr2g0103041 [Rosa chinensis]|uniref:Uncharacterized protein n=1 Tax=Rosa chinensis TaxID=74649 RepID=A0A2P6RMT8_ROSCH|nr:hypothetical protein RchiOBHm_Chr2g0103041 [Rosa chinensis]
MRLQHSGVRYMFWPNVQLIHIENKHHYGQAPLIEAPLGRDLDDLSSWWRYHHGRRLRLSLSSHVDLYGSVHASLGDFLPL